MLVVNLICVHAKLTRDRQPSIQRSTGTSRSTGWAPLIKLIWAGASSLLVEFLMVLNFFYQPNEAAKSLLNWHRWSVGYSIWGGCHPPWKQHHPPIKHFSVNHSLTTIMTISFYVCVKSCSLLSPISVFTTRALPMIVTKIKLIRLPKYLYLHISLC